jgi:hypothetical protein
VLAGRKATLQPGCSDIYQVQCKLAESLAELGERDAAAELLPELRSLQARPVAELSANERVIINRLPLIERMLAGDTGEAGTRRSRRRRRGVARGPGDGRT